MNIPMLKDICSLLLWADVDILIILVTSLVRAKHALWLTVKTVFRTCSIIISINMYREYLLAALRNHFKDDDIQLEKKDGPGDFAPRYILKLNNEPVSVEWDTCFSALGMQATMMFDFVLDHFINAINEFKKTA